MKVAVFSSKNYDIKYLNEANEAKGNMHELSFLNRDLLMILCLWHTDIKLFQHS